MDDDHTKSSQPDRPSPVPPVHSRFQKGSNRNPVNPGRSGQMHLHRKLVPAKHLALITEMAAKGCREKDIARCVDMAPLTWSKCLAEQDEVARAFNAGRQLLHDSLINKLYERAMSGKSDACLIYATKILLGYRENDAVPAFAPQINITLPGALPLDKIAALEGEARRLLTKERQP